MKYLTAIEASKRIGVAEKTIRLWVKKGKLEAHHPAKNRLAIAEEDVARIARERQQYYGTKPETPSSDRMQPDISALIARMEALERRVAELEQNVPEKPQAPLHRFVVDRESQPPKRNIAPSPDLPDGAIGLSDFAALHSISLSSASRWARNGDIPTELRQRAGRPQHFLTIEQQEQAIEWLGKHGKLS